MNGSKKNILLICDANLNRAPRVRAIYNALKESYTFTMAGYDQPPFDDVEYIRLPRKKKAKRRNISWHLKYPGSIRKMCSLLIKTFLFIVEPKEDKRSIKEKYLQLFDEVNCDLIINHHLNTLEMAVVLKDKLGVPLVSNLHEYYPREFEDQATWQQYEAPKKIQICKTLLPKADLVFSVCPGIQNEYRKEFGIDSVVMRNDKPFLEIQPSPVQGDKIRLIHHGAALKSRFLHHLIDAVGPLNDQFTLDLMLVPTQQDYYDLLAEKCI
ncbi:MAG: glycosyltransferase family 4 protein, partial [Flavobacteriales bacterium]